jgi:hypothetical protein
VVKNTLLSGDVMKKVFICAILLIIGGFAWPVKNERKSDERVIPLVSEEEIQPCCMNGKRDADANRISSVKRVPPNRYVDDITMRRLKEDAYSRPTSIRGTAISFFDDRKLQAAAPPLIRRFDGLNFLNDPGFPPDTIISAGPSHIIEMTNSGIRLSSKENSNIQTQKVTEFFERPNKFLFDPKVYFDKISNRFFAVILEFDTSPKTSRFHLAISRTPTPSNLTTDWCRYRISGISGDSAADFPGIGMNENWMALTANNFRFSDDMFSKVLIKVINKSVLVNNTNSCPAIKVFSFTNPNSFTVQPALHYSATNLPGNPLFMVSTIFGPNNRYELWRIKGAVGSKPSLTKTNVTGLSYSIPPNAKHKGEAELFDTSDNRMLQVAFRNGSLWSSFTTGCSFGELPNESCVRVVQIIPNESSGATGFEASIGGGANRFFWMPGIAVNQSNDVVITFQRSSPGLFLGTAYTGKRNNASKFEPFRVAKAGQCNLKDVDDSGRNRTGDYTGAQADPVDSSFWIAGEYPSLFNGRCEWNTVIARVKYN